MKRMVFLALILTFDVNAAECGIWSNDKLSENMKKLYLKEIDIPVSSSMLKNASDFLLNIHEDGGSDVQSGRGLKLENLNDKEGYAYVTFTLNTPIREIPIVANDIMKNYASVKNYESFKITNVKGELLFQGADNSIIATHEFDMIEEFNKVIFCDFYKIEENVKRIIVTIKSWRAELSELTVVK